MSGNGHLVTLAGVRKTFGDNVVLDAIDLEIDRGSAVVVAGPSGSGKSTMLRCINGLEPIDSGLIRFDGRSVESTGREIYGIRAQIGMVLIRDVAKAAGVSPGLIQHHFATKAGLRDAVNQYVIETIADAFGDLTAENAPEETFADLGNRITRTVGENPTALLYVGRSLAEGDEAALGLFDALVEISLAQYERLAERRELRTDVDLEWAAMHIVIGLLIRLVGGPDFNEREKAAQVAWAHEERP